MLADVGEKPGSLSVLLLADRLYSTQPSTLSARMLTSSESQWPAGQKGRRMSRAFTIFTKLVMTWIVGNTDRHTYLTLL